MIHDLSGLPWIPHGNTVDPEIGECCGKLVIRTGVLASPFSPLASTATSHFSSPDSIHKIGPHTRLDESDAPVGDLEGGASEIVHVG